MRCKNCQSSRMYWVRGLPNHIDHPRCFDCGWSKVALDPALDGTVAHSYWQRDIKRTRNGTSKIITCQIAGVTPQAIYWKPVDPHTLYFWRFEELPGYRRNSWRRCGDRYDFPAVKEHDHGLS